MSRSEARAACSARICDRRFDRWWVKSDEDEDEDGDDVCGSGAKGSTGAVVVDGPAEYGGGRSSPWSMACLDVTTASIAWSKSRCAASVGDCGLRGVNETKLPFAACLDVETRECRTRSPRLRLRMLRGSKFSVQSSEFGRAISLVQARHMSTTGCRH